MRHFAAAEAQGDLHLVAFLEEAVHRARLDLVVVDVDVGTELDLLDLHHLLPLARLVLLLLLLELELAVVQDLADGRVGVGNDLHQVQAGFFGSLDGCGGRHDALFLTVLVDEQDAGDSDVFVHARPFFDGRRLHGAANRQCSGTVETNRDAGACEALRSLGQYMTRGYVAIKACGWVAGPKCSPPVRLAPQAGRRDRPPGGLQPSRVAR